MVVVAENEAELGDEKEGIEEEKEEEEEEEEEEEGEEEEEEEEVVVVKVVKEEWLGWTPCSSGSKLLVE